MDQKLKVGPKDFFLQLGILVTLYTSVTSLLALVFDIINAQKDRAALEAPTDQPLPVINLNEKPGKQPVTVAAKPNGKANPVDAGPPPGHPAFSTHDTGGF